MAFLAPLFLLFELVQLVMSERYLGKEKIELGTDPRQGGPSEKIAAGWTLTLIVYWLWIGIMLALDFARAQVVALLAVSFVGYAIRRNCTLKWILVVLTFEGAIRIGMLLYISIRAWRYSH